MDRFETYSSKGYYTLQIGVNCTFHSVLLPDLLTHELDDFDGIFVTVMLISRRFCFRFQSSSTNKMAECFAAITGFTPD